MSGKGRWHAPHPPHFVVRRASGNDWLQKAPGLRPTGEWKPKSVTYSVDDPGLGKDSRIPTARAEPLLSLTPGVSAFTPLQPTHFIGEIEFTQVAIGWKFLGKSRLLPSS